MKKYFSLFLVIIMLFSMNGCSKNSTTIPNNAAYTQSEELTNPGEYLVDYCSSITLNDISIALPTTFEKLNELFVLEKIPSSVTHFDDDGGYDQIFYNVFTKEDNLYCGTTVIMHYDNGETFVRRFDENEKNDYWYLPENQVYHLGDKIGTSLGAFKTLETRKKEIQEKLGEAFIIDESGCEYYTFEDADLILYYGNNVLIGFQVNFK